MKKLILTALAAVALAVGMAPVPAGAGDGYWSQGCGNTYWYGVPGSGSWYYTLYPGPEKAIWVGGGFWQVYNKRGFECNLGASGVGYPRSEATSYRLVSGAYVASQTFSNGMICASTDRNWAVSRGQAGVEWQDGGWYFYSRRGSIGC